MKAKISMIYADNNFPLVGDFPPLGALYIISFLKQKGIDADFYDFPIIKNWKKKLHEIIDSNPEVIGLGSTVSNIFNTHFLAKFIKSHNKDIKIIVGGPYPTCVPEKYLNNKAIDAICIGEGEYTFYNYIINGDKAPGLMVRKNGSFFRTEPTPKIENLDALPFPDLSQVDLGKYHYIFKKRKPLSSIMTSRGCPHQCIYCFHAVHGFKWRGRSPKNVVEEIKWQFREFGVRELAFWDDNFTFDQQRAEKICDLLIQDKVDMSMSTPNGVRVDKVNKNLLYKMKKAGFWVIVLTPETGDPFILKKLKKGFTLEQTEKVAKWVKELGLLLVVYYMMGFPFETEEHVKNSLKFLKKIKPDVFNVNKFYPFPKTPIVDEYNLKTSEGYDYRIMRMSKEFERLLFSAYLHFYSNPANLWNIIKKVGMFRFFESIFKLFRTDIKNRLKMNDYAVSLRQ